MNFRRAFTRPGLYLPLLVASVAACGESTGVGTTTNLSILLTDAPADYIDQAMVDIGAVELRGGPDGAVVLTEDGTDGFVNLLDLQGAATSLLASVDIDAGTYNELRLIVEAASVTLIDGYQFDDGSTTQALSVPSGAQTGIKLKLRDGDTEGSDGGIDFVPGEMVLVLDFDVNESFVLQGNPETPAGLKSISFRPTIRVVVNNVAGSISGSVSTALAEVSVEGLVVSAVPVDEEVLEEGQTASATTMTDSDGVYTLFFLAPGDYVVSVAAGEGLMAAPETTTVTVGASEDVTDVDFEIVGG